MSFLFSFHRSFPSAVALGVSLLLSSLILLLLITTGRSPGLVEREDTAKKFEASLPKREREFFNKRRLKETISLAMPGRVGGRDDLKSRSLQELNQLPSPPEKKEPHGYVILQSLSSTSISSSLSQLLVFQCWAKRLHLSLVEPSINKDSSLSTPSPRDPSPPDSLSLDALYDLSSWEKLSRIGGGLAPFVGVEDVEARDAREVLVVDVSDSKYNSQIKANDGSSIGCMNDSSAYRSRLHLQLGLSVTQELCLSSSLYSLKELLDMVEDFAGFLQKQSGSRQASDKTVVIFRNWDAPSLTTAPSSADSAHTCENLGRRVHKLQPSAKILGDARNYANRMGGKRGGARTAIVLTDKTQSSHADFCYERILTHFHTLRNTRNASRPYLALSNPLAPATRRGGMEGKLSFKMFFRALYAGRYTPSSWRDKVLLQTSSVKHNVYASVLNQVIASESRCLVITSSDAYSNTIERWYQETDGGRNNCLVKVEECYTIEE